MALKRITCRTHGGIFSIEPRRGRPPVKCGQNGDPLCDKAQTVEAEKSTVARVKTARAAKPITPEERQSVSVAVRGTRKPSERAVDAPKLVNPSLPLAMAAKAHLEAVGWLVNGRAGFDEASGSWAGITATRDQESLVMRWEGTSIVQQSYSLEYQKPSDNGIPGRKLDFDPDELTDAELVERIKGMKVTWWNTLANSTESGIVGSKITISHVFDDDMNKRIVNFIDRGGSGFRSFAVTALMKVG